MDEAMTIKLQLTMTGKPLSNRVFFLPNLSTIKVLISGANMCPKATMATNVEMDDAVTGIGESSDISITMLGEFHPMTNPMQPLMIEPDIYQCIYTHIYILLTKIRRYSKVNIKR